MPRASVDPQSAASSVAESDLLGVVRALGVSKERLTPNERRLLVPVTVAPNDLVRRFEDTIGRGDDPLGDAFCRLRSAAVRRPLGATYTPAALVRSMIGWASRHEPVRVVDPGAGSGRFLVAAGRAFPRATLVGVELDPLAALLCRAHLRAAGLADRARVVVGDYRELSLAPVRGPTLFVGNPPYVRHHDIAPRFKRWLSETAATFGLSASQLAGLHVHFALKTATLGRPGDYGAFVTAAEWLDVNYGSLLRALFCGALGGTSLDAVAPTARVFADAETTAVVACFEFGSAAATVRVRAVKRAAALGTLAMGRELPRERLVATARWTELFRKPAKRASGMVELGELCEVHRGQVTGKNRVWIAGEHSRMLPENVLFRAVTRARELFLAGAALHGDIPLRRVIDLPAELDGLSESERRAVRRFLVVARRLGADRGFVAEHRRAWWAVGLREPAPILATYMARRPPAFVRNLACARHINIAHGLYPRERLSQECLDALAGYLARSTRLSDGRTYSGGLTKFEPREMERLLVPEPALLAAGFAPERARRGKLL